MTEEEIWKLVEELVTVDNLEVSDYFKKLEKEELKGNITKEEMLNLIIKKYKVVK